MGDDETDEDWFERALRELDGSSDDDLDDFDDLDDLPTGADRDAIGSAMSDADDAESDVDGADDAESDVDGADDAESDADDVGDAGEAEATGGPQPDPAEADPFGGTRGDEESAAGEGSAAGTASFDEVDDPFGGDSGDPFGGDPDGDAFGFADFGGSGGEAPETFDETAAFESDIDRIDVGIKGLDEMILGGVPRRALMSVIGSAGTGKTTFALQFLNEALKNGENGVYITLEESRESIIDTAEEKGWPFEQYADEGRLAVVALDPVEMANSLASLRSDLSRLITDFGAERLVLDSVSLLELMYDHPSKRRSEVFDFTRSLKRAGVTTLLTSEASEDSPYTSKHGIVEYLTDAVFVLQYVRPSDFRETRLAVEILKIRDANHSRETKPYEITNTGLSVYRQANIF